MRSLADTFCPCRQPPLRFHDHLALNHDTSPMRATTAPREHPQGTRPTPRDCRCVEQGPRTRPPPPSRNGSPWDTVSRSAPPTPGPARIWVVIVSASCITCRKGLITFLRPRLMHTGGDVHGEAPRAPRWDDGTRARRTRKQREGQRKIKKEKRTRATRSQDPQGTCTWAERQASRMPPGQPGGQTLYFTFVGECTPLGAT